MLQSVLQINMRATELKSEPYLIKIWVCLLSLLCQKPPVPMDTYRITRVNHGSQYQLP